MASRLTETEARIMRLAAAGLRAEEIAEALDLTRRTVAWHLTQSYRKLGLARPAGPREPQDRSHRRLDDAQT
jgi:DNA-binding CsgD family transcriptional regulator